ncbi:MAG: DUF255 domain-containing protein, partial [Pseudomonadota bacterium]
HLKDGDAARYVNRLISEASPYLLQHAHNPVDWHPWSDETLAKAKALDRPVFLSVGYATCHWCHVMEEESFDDEEVASVLNRYFIPVKIDREQMPALDHFFITATQLQQGHAGWPNSVWMLPDARPFHTGTYFPRDVFLQMLSGIGQSFGSSDQRSEINRMAERLSDAVREITQMAARQSVPLGEDVMRRAAQDLLQMHNALDGGFSQSQQFPQEGYVLWLMDHWRRTGDDASLQVATETLHAIAAGGIHDHVGGGFHRYAVDPHWRTPHFEKMLFNQGLLARAFVEAWEITGEPAFRRAAERTFEYIARDMTDADGAFFAAEDADSMGADGVRHEGLFYAWTPEEVSATAGAEALAALGVDQSPTIEAGAVIHFDPSVVPDFALVDPMLDALREARDVRVRPIRDDKVIAGWNGLMIRALAEGAAAFNDQAAATRARRAAEVLWSRLWTGDGLRRLWVEGQAREDGALEDYAWLGLGYLALGDATGDPVWRDRAVLLARAMWTTFGDGEGRLRMSQRDGPLGAIYDGADGAVPSGESAALELLARLARRTGDLELDAWARTLRAALSAPMADQPLLRPDALSASRILDEGETGRRQIRAAGKVAIRLHADRLEITIADGWHLNAHDPGPDWLIGADLTGAVADWPAGREVTLSFSKEPLKIYEGGLDIPLSDAFGLIEVALQACSDEICLEPERIRFRLH